MSQPLMRASTIITIFILGFAVFLDWLRWIRPYRTPISTLRQVRYGRVAWLIRWGVIASGVLMFFLYPRTVDLHNLSNPYLALLPFGLIIALTLFFLFYPELSYEIAERLGRILKRNHPDFRSRI